MHTLFTKLHQYQNHSDIKNNEKEIILTGISIYFLLFSPILIIDFKGLPLKSPLLQSANYVEMKTCSNT